MGFSKFTIDDYEITREGEVINKRWGRKVRPQKNGKGYLRVWIDGKLRFVHRLVAEKYVPNPDNKPQVNHKDGNKLNNNADNLEWVTNYENRQHAIQHNLHFTGEKCSWAKLNKEKVIFIRNHPEIKAKELAELFGVTNSTIKSIRNYKSWKTEKIC